jgi:hypothetical protein
MMATRRGQPCAQCPQHTPASVPIWEKQTDRRGSRMTWICRFCWAAITWGSEYAEQLRATADRQTKTAREQ